MIELYESHPVVLEAVGLVGTAELELAAQRLEIFGNVEAVVDELHEEIGGVVALIGVVFHGGQGVVGAYVFVDEHLRVLRLVVGEKVGEEVDFERAEYAEVEAVVVEQAFGEHPVELWHTAPVDEGVGHLCVGVVVRGTGNHHVAGVRPQARGEGGLFIDDFIGDVVRFEIVFVLVSMEVAPDDEVGTLEMLGQRGGFGIGMGQHLVNVGVACDDVAVGRQRVDHGDAQFLGMVGYQGEHVLRHRRDDKLSVAYRLLLENLLQLDTVLAVHLAGDDLQVTALLRQLVQGDLRSAPEADHRAREGAVDVFRLLQSSGIRLSDIGTVEGEQIDHCNLL